MNRSIIENHNINLQEVLAIVNSLPNANDSTIAEVIPSMFSNNLKGRIMASNDALQQMINIVMARDILIDFEFVKRSDGSYELTGWKGTCDCKPSKEIKIPDVTQIIIDLNL